jgi:hypothetical protein
MANPEAVMRAAQPPMGGKMGGGMPEHTEGQEAAPKGPEGAAGLGGMMDSLKGVGDFLKSQGPAGQQALGHFQAMLQAMASLGQGEPEQATAPEEPAQPGRIHESKVPGTVVL